MKDIYHHSSHSKYSIKLHFVFAGKYRKQLFTSEIQQDIKQIIFDRAKRLKPAYFFSQKQRSHDTSF
jgi:REP element-mobilizing transposase RayT